VIDDLVTGRNATTLQHKLSPTHPSHTVNIQEFGEILELTKRLCIRGREVILMSENPKYPPRYVLEGDELAIWGVITSSVRSHV